MSKVEVYLGRPLCQPSRRPLTAITILGLCTAVLLAWHQAKVPERWLMVVELAVMGLDLVLLFLLHLWWRSAGIYVSKDRVVLVGAPRVFEPTSLPLGDLFKVSVVRSWIGSRLGFGTIMLHPIDAKDALPFPFVPDPEEARRALERARDEAKQEVVEAVPAEEEGEDSG